MDEAIPHIPIIMAASAEELQREIDRRQRMSEEQWERARDAIGRDQYGEADLWEELADMHDQAIKELKEQLAKVKGGSEP